MLTVVVVPHSDKQILWAAQKKKEKLCADQEADMQIDTGHKNVNQWNSIVFMSLSTARHALDMLCRIDTWMGYDG